MAVQGKIQHRARIVHQINLVIMCVCVCVCARMMFIRLVRLVALALHSLDSKQPLSFLSSSVVEHLPSKQYVMDLSHT